MASGQNFYTPDNWFGSQVGGGSSETRSSASSSMTGSGYSEAESYGSSESEADIPIFFPVPFEELSSVQYHSEAEQLTAFAAALKLQFQRHCFIQVRQRDTQPMLVPFVEPITTFKYSRKNLDCYIAQQNVKQQALPAADVDRLLEQQETALLQAAASGATLESLDSESSAVVEKAVPPPATDRKPIWSRVDSQESPEQASGPLPRPRPRKRGPKADVENHRKVAAIIRAYGEEWTTDENLMEICDELDRLKIPVPKPWASRLDGVARSWSRGLQHYPGLVRKAIKDRCKAAGSKPTAA